MQELQNLKLELRRLKLEKLRRLEEKAKIERWKRDPVAYARERLGLFIWPKLEEILISVRDNPETAVQSANGIGKTELGGVIVPWFLECHPDSVVLTTGSSWQALEEHLWPRIKKHIRKHGLFPGAQINKMGITVSNTSYAYARSAKEPEGIMGAHAPHLLQLVEESSGIGYDIGKAISGNATGEHDRRVYFGNPLNPEGQFYDWCKNPRVNTIKVSAFDHPNVIEGREVIPGAVTRGKIREKAEDWCTPCAPNTPGAVHLWWLGDKGWFMPDPTFTARVLGEFPSVSVDSLYSEELIDKAMERALKDQYARALGCDVARSVVGDETTIFLVNRYGHVLHSEYHRGWDTVRTANRIKELVEEHPSIEGVAVDDIGVGGGVTDNLKAMGVPNTPFVANAPPKKDAKRFLNIKAEMYWNLKLRLERDESFVLPKDDVLKRQMKNVRRGFTLTAMKIESKDEYKKRTGESPDRLEGLIIATFALEYGKSDVRVRISGPKRENDFSALGR